MRSNIGIALVLAGAVSSAACSGTNAFGSQRVPTNAGGSSSGTISGQVQSGGSGLGGVRVLLGNRDSTVTNTSGNFAFDSLDAGSYTLAVRVPVGFALAAGETGQRSLIVAANGGTVTTSFNLRQNSAGAF
jgi:hypothetical protein